MLMQFVGPWHGKVFWKPWLRQSLCHYYQKNKKKLVSRIEEDKDKECKERIS